MDCLDVWLNTQAPQAAIDAGLAPAHDVTGQSAPSPVITDNSGMYHANPDSPVFIDWCAMNNVPLDDISGDILDGVGCPYTGPGKG